MPSWIDFKELRSKLKFEDVLQHYKVAVKRRGEQHIGLCPLPGHSGNRNTPSFSANLERGIFHCFGCHAKGNILDFAVLMNGERPDDGRALKKVAAELRARFCPDDAELDGRKPAEAKPEKPSEKQLEIEAVVNAPLDFELQGLDKSHPYLQGRGFVKETILQFGLGYCSRGYLAGRIAIPLHDTDGKLIGYAGRVVDDKAVTEENPRYKLPTKRERNGTAYEFRTALFLYNGFRIKVPCDDLIVVQGFPSVWWLHQNGFPNAVATMGAECSDEQAHLIISQTTTDGRVWIMPNSDPVGEKFAHLIFEKVSAHRFVRWAKAKQGKQPTDLSAHELKSCLGM